MISTGLSISSLGKVPIEILPGKRHITWVSALLLFTAEFQMEPLALKGTILGSTLEFGRFFEIQLF